MRTRGSRPLLLSAQLVALLALAPAPAFADLTKGQCVDANTTGQNLRREGKMSLAREQLRACASPSCPAMVRDDCTKRLDELERAQPTIIFDVKDLAGRDVSSVQVVVDGRALADRLDGTALGVDPGEHAFTFVVAGQAPLTQTFVIKEGEKERRERILVGAAVAASPAGERPVGHLVVAAGQGATVTVDDKVAGQGRFDGQLAVGAHEVRVTEPGKIPYAAQIDLHEGETRTVEVTLEEEHRRAIWPWIVGGAVVAAGAVVGGYLLFKPSDTVGAVPPGKFGTVSLASWRP